MSAKPQPVLHHAPPSFYSQIARLVLAEKRVPYQRKLTAAGPPTFETYAPDYIRANPQGTVPMLRDAATPVPDSRQILTYVDANFGGPALTPTEPEARARMEAVIEAVYAIEIRVLTYSSERMQKTGQRVNGMRAKRLRKLAEQHPDLREVYLAKLRDIETFSQDSLDADAAANEARKVEEMLDLFERNLASHPFVAGDGYSLADVVATIAVARLLMLKRDPCATRPALAAWFERMRARPSYDDADVWDHFKPERLAGMLLSKLWPVLLVITISIGALVWLLT